MSGKKKSNRQQIFDEIVIQRKNIWSEEEQLMICSQAKKARVQVYHFIHSRPQID